MLDRIIHFSIGNKLLIGFFTIALIIVGSIAVSRLPIDALPDITNNQVQVLTVSPANSAEDIERLVTFPVEQTMSTIPGIEEIRSISRFGLSVVTIVFDDGVDIYWARQQVSERLNTTRELIPVGIGQPTLAPVTTGLGEIFQYVIRPEPGTATKYTPVDLRTIQDWIVRRQLLGVHGVADVSSFGGYLKQYEVALDPQRLRSLDVSIDEIASALEKNNQNAGGAYIDRSPNAYFIRSEGLINSLDDIGNIVVKQGPQGLPVLVRDAGVVRMGSAIRYGAMTFNDEGEVVGGIVLMLKGANSSEVIKNVKERIAQIQRSLPDGVTIAPFLDRTKLVNSAITTVTRNLAEGALIVLFVLVIMLGNLRAGLIVASVIPLSMLFAVTMMDLFGVSGNLMSLGAIDFGLIVDGAVIIVEATMHHLGLTSLSRRLTQQEMDVEVYQSASKIRTSAAFGEIIILIVYLPVLVLVGVEGKMFRPMAQTVSFAILGAFLLSVTYVPMMSAVFLSKTNHPPSKISQRIMSFFQRIYQPAIEFCVHRRVAVILVSVVMLAASLLLFVNLGAEFIPTLEEGDFAVETRLLNGSSLSKTIEVAGQTSKVLLANFPEVEKVIGKIGTSEIPTDPMPLETGDMIIVLKDKSTWTSASSRDELANKMQAVLQANVPGVFYGFQQPIQMRFNELMTGARQDVVMKIYGEDMEQLTRYANAAGALARQIEGAEDIYVEKITGLPQFVVDFDRARLAQFGLNIEDANRVIQAGFAGQKAGVVFEGEKRFDLVLRLDEDRRNNINDLRSLLITTPAGTKIPLDQVASVEQRSGPNQIQRDDAKRRIVVGFNVRGRDVESIVDEISQKMDATMHFAPGYFVTYGGVYKNLQQARARLYVAVPAALALILTLLYFTFHSVRQSVLIFSAIPFSAIGGILALWLRDMPFSISAGIGFIALFGVAVLNGIVLVAEFNNLRSSGVTDMYEIVRRATITRLRPIIMTALVASLGFLPMALSAGSGAEVQKPLATVVIGGLITSTLLTLLVLPCLYIMFQRRIVVNMKTAITALFFLVPLASMSQQPDSILADDAVKIALTNSPGLEAFRFEVEAQRALRKASTDIGKTNVLATLGQYNGYPKNDNNITITQSIPFPAVFAARKNLGDAYVRQSELGSSVAQAELTYQVHSAWYELNYLLNKQPILAQLDSTLQKVVANSKLRESAGDISNLERMTAQSRAAKASLLFQQNEADIRIATRRLQSLLNVEAPPKIPQALAIRGPSTALATSTLSESNLRMKLYQQAVDVSRREMLVQKNSQLPDITLGYFNQTLIGVPLDAGGVAAGKSNRFQGFQVGLSIPIWALPAAKKVEAARRTAAATEKRYLQHVRNFEAEVSSLVEEANKYSSLMEYHRSTALPQAAMVMRKVEQSLTQGEYGLSDYLLGIQTAAELRLGYVDAVHLYNQALLRLELLFNY